MRCDYLEVHRHLISPPRPVYVKSLVVWHYARITRQDQPDLDRLHVDDAGDAP